MKAVRAISSNTSTHRWRKIAVIFALWTVLAILSAGETYVSQIVWDKPVKFTLALRRSFEEWYLWAALTPFIIWLSGRFHLERATLRRWLGIHFAAALVVAVVYMTRYAALLRGRTSCD